jgi:hypothetical protein
MSDQTSKNDYIEQAHPDYAGLRNHYSFAVMLMGGLSKVMENSSQTLPRNQYESDLNYQARKFRAVLYNVYRSTVVNLSRKPFTEKPKFDPPLPEKYGFVESNIDGSGMNLTSFLRKQVEDKLVYGKYITMVNMNQVDPEMSEADRIEKGINPFCSRINPDALFSWYYDKEGLAMIKIKYQVEVMNESTHEVTKEDRIDVHTRDKIENWKKTSGKDNSGWILDNESPNKIGKIFLVIGDSIYDLPELEDMAMMNGSHFRKMSDLDNITHVVNTPFLLFTGVNKDQVEAIVSVNRAYSFSSKDANIRWIQPDAGMISQSADELKAIEARLRVAGAEIITERKVTKTATESSAENRDKMSTLESIVNGVIENWKKIGAYMAELLGDKNPPEFNLWIFKDFNIASEALDEINLIMKSYLSNAISRETFLKELSRRKIMADDWDPEAEADLLVDDGGDEF